MPELPSHSAGADTLAPPNELDTKQRLLQAAIRIFAERGFQATSMRAITQEAGTSLSAANYHFGSKEELLRAALQGRADILNARRRELLRRVEAAAAPDGVEGVIDAYIRPVFERQAEMMTKGTPPPALAIRLYLDPLDVISKIRHEAFDPTNRLFVEALARVLPDAPPEQVERALRFVLGVVVYAVTEFAERELEASNPSVHEHSQLESVVAFAAAGVRAVTGVSVPGRRNRAAERGESP